MVKQRKPLEGCVELPLFPAAAGKGPAKGPRTGEEAATKRVRAVGYAHCPRCSREKLGAVAEGSHVVWRLHVYRTHSGAALACSAGGVALCVLPAKVEPGAAPLGCVH